MPPDPVLEFPVVQPRGAARHDQHDFFADPQADGLQGDLRGLHAMRGGGQRHRRRTRLGDDDFDIGGSFGEEGADGFKAHAADHSCARARRQSERDRL